MNYFSIEKKEAVEWYKNNFNLIDDNSNYMKKTEPDIKEIFNSYKKLTNQQIEFLKNR